jgi:hypothetical protein
MGYLDAGSGSMIASAIAAGGAGIAVLVKVGFRRFTGLFSPKRRREAAEARAAEANAAVEGS